jgi:DJ-1/PfpI family
MRTKNVPLRNVALDNRVPHLVDEEAESPLSIPNDSVQDQMHGSMLLPMSVAMNTVYLLICNGYADWEPASALAELRRTFGFLVKSVGMTREPVLSMGGLRVVPDLALSEFEPEMARMLILPGGDFWIAGEFPDISTAIQRTISANRPVAAIAPRRWPWPMRGYSRTGCTPVTERTS